MESCGTAKVRHPTDVSSLEPSGVFLVAEQAGLQHDKKVMRTVLAEHRSVNPLRLRMTEDAAIRRCDAEIKHIFELALNLENSPYEALCQEILASCMVLQDCCLLDFCFKFRGC